MFKPHPGLGRRFGLILLKNDRFFLAGKKAGYVGPVTFRKRKARLEREIGKRLFEKVTWPMAKLLRQFIARSRAFSKYGRCVCKCKQSNLSFI
jgi:hypothetical protein